MTELFGILAIASIMTQTIILTKSFWEAREC